MKSSEHRVTGSSCTGKQVLSAWGKFPAIPSIHPSPPTDTPSDSASLLALFVCLFFVCASSWSPASCQPVYFSWASAQSWLLSFWFHFIPDVGKTSVLWSCLVLADSQTAAAVPAAVWTCSVHTGPGAAEIRRPTEAGHLCKIIPFLLCIKFREGRCVAWSLGRFVQSAGLPLL